jgi:hypothetical protein
VLEDQNCQAQYFHASDLKDLMKSVQINLDFVFIASCHSESFADIFFEAGAYHVIGIKKTEKVADDACVTFTMAFYKRLWQSGSKVCVCFD